MAKKEELVIGIDIGTHAVKICQLQRVAKGGYRLLAAGGALLPAEAVEDGAIHEPEAVGKVVAANDIDALVNTLETFSFDAYSVDQCVARAQEFAKETMIKNYMKMLINEETANG